MEPKNPNLNDLNDLNDLTRKIEQWGTKVGIRYESSPYAQFTKTVEETHELGTAIQENNRDEIKDAIGDIYVTLVMQTMKWDLTMEECIQQAYDTIKVRKGRMVNGQFVKENAE